MKTDVEYYAGDGRYTKRIVDFMVVWVDGVRLYAELPVYEDGVGSNYDALRESILVQADEYGIARDNLRFWFDV